MVPPWLPVPVPRVWTEGTNKGRHRQIQPVLWVPYRRLSGEVSVDSRNGPAPVFNKAVEEAMAKWLSEMAMRGMGLTPKEFLEFMQRVATKEKRKTPFRNNLPKLEEGSLQLDSSYYKLLHNKYYVFFFTESKITLKWSLKSSSACSQGIFKSPKLMPWQKYCQTKYTNNYQYLKL